MTDDPLIGRRLANFQVEKPLGRGGMAQVYYGYDVKLRRPVAIKVIDARYRDKPAYAERFVREAQAIATWRHENIIQIYYADDEEGFYYFAMEYIDGSDLGKILAEYKSQNQFLPHDEVLRIGRAIASALDYAHKKGIIHRDVKPSNVLVAQDGRVVLTDFGLAMDAEAGSQGEVFGSAHYVAPEQARNSAEAVAQSDLYALGIILYEMLTGRVPFTDPSSTAVAIQHLTQPPPPPRSLNPQLNQETETVLLKALSKSPQERYQTGREMLDELELALYLNDATIASPLKPSVAAPAAKNRSLLYIGLAAGFGLTLIFILSLFLATTFFFSQSEQSEAIAATGTVVVDEVSVSDPVPTTEPTVMPDQPTVEAVPVEATATVPPTPEPTPTSGPTPEPLPQLLADTFNDFATNQEGKWRYIWAEPDTAQWSPLRYEERRYGSCWYAEDYIRICPDSGHPGNGADIGWYWTGEVGGPIELQLSASKKDRGGDGVIIAVYYNTLSTTDEPLFQTSLDGRDNEGFTEKIRIENFAPDDSLLLVIRKSRDATSDHTAFQARVCHYACP